MVRTASLEYFKGYDTMKWVIVIIHLSIWDGSITKQEILKGIEYTSKETCLEAANTMQYANIKVVCGLKSQ